MAGPTLDFWFDFASTYSYLAAVRIRPLAAQAGVSVRFRPFLLGPIFKAQGWDTSPFNLYPVKGRHMWRDLERLAEDLSVPFRRPDPFPQNSLHAARVAIAGLGRGWGEDFSVAVFRAQFADGRRIDEPATLAAILSGMNVDAKTALDTAQSDANKLALRAQTDEARRLGIFGAPSFTTASGELFWGNDRLEQALVWAKR
jgi:2-hydroxychromene-2-carboxylate isomerase